jgi:hypothetical protein
MDDNPAGVLGIVLDDLSAGELALSHRDDYSLIDGRNQGRKKIIKEKVRG